MKGILWQGIIPLAPKTKKNSVRIARSKSGRRFVLPSAEYERYEREAGWFIKAPDAPIDTPVNVCCMFYMPTKRRVDLVNLLNCILDVLVKHGVLADDNCKIVVSMDGSRVLYDKESPRTEVFIEA